MRKLLGFFSLQQKISRFFVCLHFAIMDCDGGSPPNEEAETICGSSNLLKN
ncbi:Hypothetical protein TPAS_1696 [Trichococcus pasteurii]|uniref:Uncharacterized protein n=1 Tax=Trichococcus pasteurii TaxID=43064 RepID=A0A1W1IG82_9LACT|nr:hypothetical protein SAMN04488086_11745 [Trichococcus pasteurii]SLM52016.1 Hypothetical protein TPAS_1696 [Trichococcus pasteurii]SSB92897.1 Hypothetical protein TPAS_1696 [Trichococcus pasteurii]